VLLQQIDDGGGSGQYFGDLLGEQEGAGLHFVFLKEGAQEPGLHIDRGRLRHLVLAAARFADRRATKLKGKGEGPRTCKFAAAPVT
jgi:hypothetical protein